MHQKASCVKINAVIYIIKSILSMLFFFLVFKKSTESSLQRPQHHSFPALLRQSQLGNLRFTLTCAKASSHRNEDDVIKLERPPCLSPFPISKEKRNAAPSDLQLIRFLYRQPHRWGLQLWFEMSKSSHPPPTPSLPQPIPPLQQVPCLPKGVKRGLGGSVVKAAVAVSHDWLSL